MIVLQIYYILCNCSNPKDYVGSAIDGKRRWSKHKSDIRKENWDNYAGINHQKVFLQDSCKKSMTIKPRPLRK